MARITFLATLLAAFMLLLTIASANPVHHKGKHHHKAGSHHAGADEDDTDVKPHHPHGASGGKDISDFKFRPSHSAHITCPSSNGKSWTGGHGTKFGVLCGYDTKSHAYKEVLHHLTFEQCAKACSHLHWCTVATYVPKSGCYLKKHANGKGYYKVGKATSVQTAVKLNKGGASKWGKEDDKE